MLRKLALVVAVVAATVLGLWWLGVLDEDELKDRASELEERAAKEARRAADAAAKAAREAAGR